MTKLTKKTKQEINAGFAISTLIATLGAIFAVSSIVVSGVNGALKINQAKNMMPKTKTNSTFTKSYDTYMN